MGVRKIATFLQPCLEMPRLAPGWPGHTLRGPQWPHVAPTGLSRGVWAIQRPVGASQGHSVSLRTTSGQYEYVLVSFQNPVLFCKYLSPLKSHKIGSVFKIYIWISVFREKNGLEICSLVLEILNKQTFERFFFLNSLYRFTQV